MYNGVRSENTSLIQTDTSLPIEHISLTKRVGLLDRSMLGRIKLTGEDSLDLLNRLSTNNLANLEIGQAIPTVLTSNKGRIVDLLFVLRRKNDTIVFTSPETRKKVIEWIDFYTFFEDVTITDITEKTDLISIAGHHASDVLNNANIPSPELYESIEVKVAEYDVLVVRTDHLRMPEYYLLFASSSKLLLRKKLIEAGRSDGLTEVSEDTIETIRIENGIPAYGTELSEKYNPLEAGLFEMISFDKGCYVGQEVVTRLNTYQKVQKYLVKLSWDVELGIKSGAKLLLGGKQIGLVTSSAMPPIGTEAIGLGYVKKTHREPGTIFDTDQYSGVVKVRPIDS